MSEKYNSVHEAYKVKITKYIGMGVLAVIILLVFCADIVIVVLDYEFTS